MPRICLDAGHSGETYNTGGWGYYESRRMWDLSILLEKALKNRGFEVLHTRKTITEQLGVYDRGVKAKGCDCFISLHSNACGTESVDYPVIYRAYDNKNNADEISLKISKAIGVLMGTKQTGRTATKTTPSGTEYWGVMRGARAVGCPLYMLIEHSFHTNEKASKWLLDDGNLQKLAELEADLLAEYFGPTSESGSVSEPLDTAEPIVTGESVNYPVKVSANSLNIRTGAGTNYDIVGCITDHGVYTIVEEKNGWGKLKSGAGWVCLDYTARQFK